MASRLVGDTGRDEGSRDSRGITDGVVVVGTADGTVLVDEIVGVAAGSGDAIGVGEGIGVCTGPSEGVVGIVGAGVDNLCKPERGMFGVDGNGVDGAAAGIGTLAKPSSVAVDCTLDSRLLTTSSAHFSILCSAISTW